MKRKDRDDANAGPQRNHQNQGQGRDKPFNKRGRMND